MNTRPYPKHPLMGVSAAVWQNGRVALVQRGIPPSAGRWALPGGLVEAGERLTDAVVREVAEETALQISAPVFVRFVEVIERDPAGLVEHHYVLAAFAAEATSGTAKAASDAAALLWTAPDDLEGHDLLPDTAETIAASRAVLDGAYPSAL